MKIKMIVSDLDDTLLNSNHSLSNENRDAVIKAQQNGVTFVLASGRPLYEMIHFAKEMQLDKYNGYLISSNGASIHHAKDLINIYNKEIDKEDIIKLFDYSKQLNTSFVFYKDNIRYVYNLTDYSKPISIVDGIEYITIDNISEVDLCDIIKVMYMDSKENTLSNLEKVKAKFDNFNCVKSYYSIIEITKKNINKGRAIKHLIKKLNVNIAEIMAIGDNYNDIDMLEAVGIRCCVGNAVESLKKISSYVSCDHDKNAIKDILIKFGVINE